LHGACSLRPIQIESSDSGWQNRGSRLPFSRTGHRRPLGTSSGNGPNTILRMLGNPVQYVGIIARMRFSILASTVRPEFDVEERTASVGSIDHREMINPALPGGRESVSRTVRRPSPPMVCRNARQPIRVRWPQCYNRICPLGSRRTYCPSQTRSMVETCLGRIDQGVHTVSCFVLVMSRAILKFWRGRNYETVNLSPVQNRPDSMIRQLASRISDQHERAPTRTHCSTRRYGPARPFLM